MEAEKQKKRTLGKSILVPSVKELAKGSLERVPDKYVQNHQEPPITVSNYDQHNQLQIPIINMLSLAAGDCFELEKLHSACKHWGFFQLINHGIDKALIEKFKLETQEFMNLPLEEKKKYWQTPTEVEGFGQAFVVSENQKLDWADIFFLTTLPKHARKPNLLPMLPLPYRNTLDYYSEKVKKLAMLLVDCMAKALKIDMEVMRKMFGEEVFQSIRMNYYPPCPEPDKVIGLTPHSDAVGLTLLLQFNEIEGLQIRKDGKWLPVKPLPDAFVVNIGDIMEIVTNGIYRSVLHRSIVNATKERISVAAFHSPAIDRQIGPLPELINAGTPPQFKQIGMDDYLMGLFTRALDGKSYIDDLRIKDVHI